jgi:hypothetical protein
MARLPERKRVVREMEGLDFPTLAQYARVDVRRGRSGSASKKPSDVVQTIREIEGGDLPEDQKVRELGFVLLDHMGEAYVRELVADVRARAAATPDSKAPTSSMVEPDASPTAAVRAGLSGVSLAEATQRFHVLTALDPKLGLDDRQELLEELRQIAARIAERGTEDHDQALAVGFLVFDFFGPEVFAEHFPPS